MPFKKLFRRHQDFSIQINQAREWLMQADAIVIGIGAGLSASGGLDYTKSHLVKEYFTDYYRMGYRSLNELQGMYSHITDENAKAYWGYWARYIKYIAEERAVENGYRDLLRLIRNREYFILTTNIDSQVQKAGFEIERVFAPQGDSRWLQCSQACCNKLYASGELLDPMIKSMNGNLEVSGNKIPRCPHCGACLIPNIDLKTEGQGSKQASYLEKGNEYFINEQYIENHKAYMDFIKQYNKQSLVFLELGVGTSQSIAIRTFFENMANQHTTTKLIRINHKEAEIPSVLSEKAISLKMDLEEAIGEIASGVVSL